MGNTCPIDYKYVNGVCYGKCPEGYAETTTGSGTETTVVCDRLVLTTNPHIYSNGTGNYEEGECTDINVGKVCEKCADRWYSPCLPGYAHAGCGTCVSRCSDGSFSDVCPSDRVNPNRVAPYLSLSTIVAVIVLFIIIISIAVSAYTMTNNDVLGVIVGDPSNDTYSTLQSITKGRKDSGLIYV